MGVWRGGSAVNHRVIVPVMGESGYDVTQRWGELQWDEKGTNVDTGVAAISETTFKA